MQARLSRRGTKTSSPGARLAGAGRSKRLGCALEAGRAAVPLASAAGDGHEEAAAAGVGAGAAA
eukprot:3714027-Pleurochrysis_carterae.AAC.1